MEYLSIQAEKRDAFGKKGNKSLRKTGRIPVEIYGGSENYHLSVTPMGVRDLIYTPDFKVAEVELDGKKHNCIVKDIQFNPVTDELQHIDLLELVPGQFVKVNVPVKYKGVSPGVKVGGKLMTQMRTVKIKTTPENLISELHLDISKLELGAAIRVRDLTVPENVEILSVAASPIAYVEVPRALKSAATAEAKAAGGKKK